MHSYHTMAEYVKEAVVEDNAGNYQKAFDLYKIALEYFSTHLKYEKNPRAKEAITAKAGPASVQSLPHLCTCKALPCNCSACCQGTAEHWGCTPGDTQDVVQCGMRWGAELLESARGMQRLAGRAPRSSCHQANAQHAADSACEPTRFGASLRSSRSTWTGRNS